MMLVHVIVDDLGETLNKYEIIIAPSGITIPLINADCLKTDCQNELEILSWEFKIWN